MTRTLCNVALGVVITAPSSRVDNLRRTVEHLAKTNPRPVALVVVGDGWMPPEDLSTPFDRLLVEIVKHRPGHEQPRNVGVRALRELRPDATHVWFLDSDLIFRPDVLAAYERAYDADPVTAITAPRRTQESTPRSANRVLMGPYEWLTSDVFDCQDDLHTDIRWASFNEHGPEIALINDLGAALGCFGGNLVWPIREFMDVGGFANELSHGRVEDGELGLRAAAAGVPMTLVREARAWHVEHAVNVEWCLQTNAVEVPLLNSWHPWVQDSGYVLTENDGARFDFRCPECDLIMNSHDVWNHLGQHRSGEPFTYNDPASVRRA